MIAYFGYNLRRGDFFYEILTNFKDSGNVLKASATGFLPTKIITILQNHFCEKRRINSISLVCYFFLDLKHIKR